MAAKMTEWHLQKVLTEHWFRDGLNLDGERFFLAAWEVMTDWRINDSKRHWASPSIDFVFLDRAGRMVFVELKRSVTTPRESWHVLCQVTHRAVVLGGTYTQERLEAAYLDCHSGHDGRLAWADGVPSLLDAHATHFARPPLDDLPGTPIRRVVMALAFRGGTFHKVADQFRTSREQALRERIGRYASRGEFKRYLALPEPPWIEVCPDQPTAYEVDPSHGRARRVLSGWQNLLG